MMGKTKNTNQYNANHLVIVKMDAHQQPVFAEVQNKDWISYGKENDYPLYLIDLYTKSAKHNAIINGRVQYVLGSGWESELKDLKLEAFINNCNSYESLNEVSRKFISDFKLFGGFCLKIIWNKAGKGTPMLEHIDWANIRSNADNDEFYYTKNWFKTKNGIRSKNRNVEDEEDYAVLEPYNPQKKKGIQLLYIKSYRPNLDVYPLPDYIGAIQYIDVDTEIANYHYNNLKNGFTSTYMLKFYNGIPTEEEQKKIEQKVKEKLAGSSNAGKFILNFSDGKDRSAEVEVIPMSDSDEQFKILNETVQQEIYSGHRISSPMLFGIKSEGQLGGRSELIEANELLQNTNIRPDQMFIEEIFNSLLQDWGINDKLQLAKLEPIGLDYFENNVWNILTDDEKREKAGLAKVEENEGTLTDKLNSMSPYLLNKVIEKLSDDEIRALVNLPSRSVQVPAPVEKEFKLKFQDLTFDHLLYRFDSMGEKKSEFEILESLPLENAKVNFVVDSENNLFAKKSDYISKLNADDRAIIDLLEKDSLLDHEALAKVLKKSPQEMQNALRRLEKNGIIKVKENKEGHAVRTPIAKAIDVLEKKGAKTEEIFVKYSYEWLPGFSDKDIATSRPFCRELLAKDKLYSREEIEKLNNEMDLNVWESRGGWRTEPGTDKHLPSCRHVWVQNLVRKF